MFRTLIIAITVSWCTFLSAQEHHGHDHFAPGHCPWCSHDDTILEAQSLSQVDPDWIPPVLKEESSQVTLLLILSGGFMFFLSYGLYRKNKQQ
jgi:hypothetical protein